LYFVSVLSQSLSRAIYFLVNISTYQNDAFIIYACYKRNILVCKKMARDKRMVSYTFQIMKVWFKNVTDYTVRKVLNIYFNYFKTK
jgi:hypothetical protein